MSTETARSQNPAVLSADPLVASDGPAVSLDAQHDDPKTLTTTKAQRVHNAVSSFVNRPSRRASKIPASVQFPLVVLLSFSLSSVGYSFLNESTRGELATITRAPESSFEVAILALWRMYVSAPWSWLQRPHVCPSVAHITAESASRLFQLRLTNRAY